MELEQENVSSLQPLKESVKPNSSTQSNTTSSGTDQDGTSQVSSSKKPPSDTSKRSQEFISAVRAIYLTPVQLLLRSAVRSPKFFKWMTACSWMYSLGLLTFKPSSKTFAFWWLVAVVAWSFLITLVWPLVHWRAKINDEH